MCSQKIPEQTLRQFARADASDGADFFQKLLKNDVDNGVKKFFAIYLYNQKNFDEAINYLYEVNKVDENDNEVKIYLMRALYSAAKYEEAKRAAGLILAADGENIEALRLMARLELNDRDFEAALPHWTRIADLNEGDTEAALQVARLAWRKEDFAMAAHYASAHLAVAPQNQDCLNILIRALFNLRRFDELAGLLPKLAGQNWIEAAKFLDALVAANVIEPVALALAEMLQSEQPNGAAEWAEHLQFSWLTDAVSKELGSDDIEAARLYRAVLIVAPGNAEARSSLARLKHPALGALREAQKATDSDAIVAAANEVLALDPECAEAHFGLGRCYLIQGQFEQAREHLGQAVARNAGNTWYQLNYGRAALKSEAYGDALDAFEAIAISPDGENKAYREEAINSIALIQRKCVSLARREIAAHEFETAWQHLHLAQRAEPGNGELESLRESVRRRMYSDVSRVYRNNPEEALEPVEAFLNLFPDNEQALVMHGRLAMKGRDYASALRSWQRAADEQPQNPHYQLQIARCHAWLKEKDAAAAAAQRALDLDPDLMEARSIIANVKPNGD